MAANRARLDTRLSTGGSLTILAICAGLIALSSELLRIPLKMPGHKGAAIMALLIVARALVAPRGAATFTAALGGTLVVMAGMADRGAVETVAIAAAAGLAVDAIASVVDTPAPLWAAMLAGGAGNLARLMLKTAWDGWIGITGGFMLNGLAYAGTTHVVFGALGGLIGFLCVQALRGFAARAAAAGQH